MLDLESELAICAAATEGWMEHRAKFLGHARDNYQPALEKLKAILEVVCETHPADSVEALYRIGDILKDVSKGTNHA